MTGPFPTPGFRYENGTMLADRVPLSEIAAAVGTPVYVYSTAGLAANWRAYAEAFAGQDVSICYALKANSNLAVVRALAAFGAGADVVSAGEMERALAAGIPADRIVFSGVGKTRDELAAAVTAGIHQINVESLPELETLAEVAASIGRRAPVALRVNPDVDAGTHGKIATGRKEDKFGIDMSQARAAFARAAALPSLDPLGVAVHIGSQLLSVMPFRTAFGRLGELVRLLRADGLAISRLDLGGGLGVPYRPGDEPPDYRAYADTVRQATEGLGCKVTLEPGRSLVASAGVLVAGVILVKRSPHRRFLVLDAAMNDLIRPALYEAWHTILPVTEPSADAPRSAMDVVGPVCESGDTFAKDRELPALAAGDLVAFLTAGAYGAVMASSYNSRAQVPEVLVDGDRFAIVRRRPTLADSLALESVPPWLA